MIRLGLPRVLRQLNKARPSSPAKPPIQTLRTSPRKPWAKATRNQSIPTLTTQGRVITNPNRTPHTKVAEVKFLAEALDPIARIRSTDIENTSFMLPLVALRSGIELDILSGSNLAVFKSLDIDFDGDLTDDPDWNSNLAKHLKSELKSRSIQINLAKLTDIITQKGAMDFNLEANFQHLLKFRLALIFLFCAFKHNMIEPRLFRNKDLQDIQQTLHAFVLKTKPEFLQEEGNEIDIAIDDYVRNLDAIVAARILITLKRNPRHFDDPVTEPQLVNFEDQILFTAMFCGIFYNELEENGQRIMANIIADSRTPQQNLLGLYFLLSTGYDHMAEELAAATFDEKLDQMHEECIVRAQLIQSGDEDALSATSPFDDFFQNDVIKFYACNFPEAAMDKLTATFLKMGLFDQQEGDASYFTLCGNTDFFKVISEFHLVRSLSLAETILRAPHTPMDFKNHAALHLLHFQDLDIVQRFLKRFVNKHAPQILNGDSEIGRIVMRIANALANPSEFLNAPDVEVEFFEQPELRLVKDAESGAKQKNTPLEASNPMGLFQIRTTEDNIFEDLVKASYPRNKTKQLAQVVLEKDVDSYVKYDALVYLHQNAPHLLHNTRIIRLIDFEIEKDVIDEDIGRLVLLAVNLLNTKNRAVLKAIPDWKAKLLNHMQTGDGTSTAHLRGILSALARLEQPTTHIEPPSPKPIQPKARLGEEEARKVANKKGLPRKDKKEFIKANS